LHLNSASKKVGVHFFVINWCAYFSENVYFWRALLQNIPKQVRYQNRIKIYILHMGFYKVLIYMFKFLNFMRVFCLA